MNRNKNGQAAPKAARAQAQSKSKTAKMAAPRKMSSVAAAYATGLSSGKAQVYRSSVDSCRMVHRELIGSLSGSVAYTVASTFAINPGLPASFPWLSIEAQGWEKYRFNSLKLCYYTRTGSNVPGSVILAADYDAADAAPVSEQVASAYYGTEEDAPWKDICFTFDRQRLAGERFIRVGALGANQDVKTYDVANAFVATVDGTAVPWGKLWLEYDVTLFNPQLPPGGASGSGTLAGNTAMSAAAPFGTAAVTRGAYALSASGLVLTMAGLQVGVEYSLFLGLVGTVITLWNGSITSGGTAKTTNFTVTQASAAQTAASQLLTFTATSASASYTVACTATTVTASDVILTAITDVPSF